MLARALRLACTAAAVVLVALDRLALLVADVAAPVPDSAAGASAPASLGPDARTYGAAPSSRPAAETLPPFTHDQLRAELDAWTREVEAAGRTVYFDTRTPWRPPVN